FLASDKQGPDLKTKINANGLVELEPAVKIAAVNAGRLLTSGTTFTLAAPARLRIADLSPAFVWKANGVTLVKEGDLFTGDVPAGTVSITAAGAAPPSNSTPASGAQPSSS